MPSMVDRNCASCQKSIQVRAADVARGWGKFCSKSCKAKKQNMEPRQYKSYRHFNQTIDDDEESYLEEEQGWDGHKDTF